MEIKAFCDSCGRDTECTVIDMEESETSFKIITVQCKECGRIFKEEMNI